MMPKKRDSSFEMLRIVAIIMVVSGHCLLHLYNNVTITVGSCEYWIINIFNCLTDCAVDVFVLITGYWGLRFHIGKLLRLFFQAFFYSVLFYLFDVFINGHEPIWRKDFLVFFPIINGLPWFITVYAALYCLAPFYNRFLAACTKIQIQSFLCVGGILFYLWPTFSFLVNSHQLVNDSGFGIVNFSYLYLLGRYISLFYKPEKSIAFYFCGFLFVGFLLLMTHYCISILLGFEFNPYFSYNTVFVLGQAVLLILLVSKAMYTGVYSNIINKVASYSLSVYLFHDCLIPVFLTELTVNSLLLSATIIPVVIYVLTIPVEILRHFLFGQIENFIVEKIEKKSLLQKVTLWYD